ncbi:MAG: hypothetical protein RLZZ502_1038 [Pseudomonadota bacterium]|jgi:outer membrane protein TolC
MRTNNNMLLLLSGLIFSACSTLDFKEQLAEVNRATRSVSADGVRLHSAAPDAAAGQQSLDQLLHKPLDKEAAVVLALAHSPEVQAMLATAWADMARAAQSGRIANPVFGFERLLNLHVLDLGRMLSLGLFDLLSLPQRQQGASAQIEVARHQLALAIVDKVNAVRQAWINAVAAKQSLHFAKQIQVSAEASAELAKRMQQVGNFSKLQRARQQAYYADATTELAQAEYLAISTREQLIRLLGMNAAQSGQLQLPERLPDLPVTIKSPQTVSASASSERLDNQLSAAVLKAALSDQGLGMWSTLTDIELAAIRNTEFAEAGKTRSRGVDISVRLPLFDSGDLARQALKAKALAALHQHEATQRAAASHLREAYSAYRTAHDIARHYRDEVLPLRKLISEENVLRYNGMLIGVFELLADSRVQIASIQAAIKAEQQFWLADSALAASILGRPGISLVGMSKSNDTKEGGH